MYGSVINADTVPESFEELFDVDVSGCVPIISAVFVMLDHTIAPEFTVPVTTIVSDEPLARLIPVRI
jgi:hypothetical protein